MNDLRSIFQADRVEQAELEQLLQMHFGSASSATVKEIQYARQGHAAALVMRYAADGKLTCIEPGPGLAADDVPQIVDKIQRLLLDSVEPAIGQIVLFSAEEPLLISTFFFRVATDGVSSVRGCAFACEGWRGRYP
jgi:hypothetical protein